MTLPPDDDQPKIIEPPIDPESDTRPLKPLRPVDDRSAADMSRRLRERRAPATILREAAPVPTPVGIPDTRRPAPPQSDDTDRVRLVPRQPESTPWRLILVTVADKPSTIGLNVREMLIVGRLDPDAQQIPDLDLTPYLGLEHGVSRQHAVLIPTVDALYIVDLDSTNGTWVNGDYLTPGQRHPLTVGDRIELGLLKLMVKSVTTYTRTGQAG